jgi:hypothetical protein
LHASGEVQSLFRLHEPPSARFFSLLQEAAAIATKQMLMKKLDRFMLPSLD